MNTKYLFVMGVGLSASLVGCNQVSTFAFVKPPVIANSQTSTQVSTVIRSLRPALAVRGVGCLMCHADIRSNLITDFGYGESYFWGGSSGVDSYYGNSKEGWQTLSAAGRTLRGSLIIPEAMVTNPTTLQYGSFTSPVSLKTFMEAPKFGGRSLVADVVPPVGSTAVIEKTAVKIEPPQMADITALDSRISSNPSLVQYVTIGEGASITGLSIRNGSSAVKYVSNFTLSGTTKTATKLSCKGDVVVNGTLFLYNPVFDANSRSCRIYVAGSVFIEGPVTYENTATSELQIASGRGIFMGFSPQTLTVRILDGKGDTGFTRGAGTVAQKAQLSINEANNLGTLLSDASSASALAQYPHGIGANNEVSSSINYNRILLVAPSVQNRYLGQIHGVVIAEIATFSLQEFHFQYDEYFSDLQLLFLPQLTKPVLTITE